MNTQTATVKMTFAPSGKIEVVVNGVKGPACTKATEALAKLGQKVKDVHTEDYDRDPDFGLVSSDGLSMG